MTETTERELAEDAQWKLIQKNTFTRWANEHLRTVNKHISDLETDLSDGLRLIALVEVLSGKKFTKYNKRPSFRTQKLENVTVCMKFLEEDEGIRIVNIDSGAIVDSNLKLILGLIWTLILHYSISMPMWDGDEPERNKGGKTEQTPKQRLLGWVQNKVGDRPVGNFTTDWNDGTAIGSLVDSIAPGLCPDWEDWSPKNAVRNATEAMDAAEQWLDVPQLIKPEEMCNPKVDELSMMTYLSQFPNAKLKTGAPLRPRTNPAKVRAYGPGLESTGNYVNAPARFTIETFSAGRGEVEVIVINPKGQREPCEVVFNNDRNLTYSCVYVPKAQGEYRVVIKFATREIPRSPYSIAVEAAIPDAAKATATGPGIERTGNVANKPTYFDVFSPDAGVGVVEVTIVDSRGRKESVRPTVMKRSEDTWHVEYTPKEEGQHTVHVLLSGKPIHDSPFIILVASAVDARKCYATGRGVQPKGIRVGDDADFKVHTKGAGEGDLLVEVLGPQGLKEPVTVNRLDLDTFTSVYRPSKPGDYVVNVTYGGQHIIKSPFKVEVGPFKETKIRAYGPGLSGGVVGHPACFTVETNGETGALGFAIEGPSQAEIDCKDNGDGSADVSYLPTAPGEYAVHILCNNDDIPKSPYMADIVPKTSKFDPTQVVASGPGLQKTGPTVNKWAEFVVDASRAGQAPLTIAALDANYKPVDVLVRDNKDGTYYCRYMPLKNIKHTVMVSYGAVSVPNSPFRVNVSEASNPAKVKVSGPALEKPVKTFQPTHLIVDCSEAGPGDVTISLTNDKGLDVPVKTTDLHNKKFKVDFEPTTVGTLHASVFFADQEIPTSPYKINAEPSVDVSKVKIQGLEDKIPVGKECNFGVVTTGAGKGQVQVSVVSPSGKALAAAVQETGDGFAVKFTPSEAGLHKVNIMFAGQSVPKSPFVIEALPQKAATPAGDPNKVKVYGPGLSEGVANSPADFTIDTRDAGKGGLGMTIEGPSEAKIECFDKGNGTCDVRYWPTEPGDYAIHVLFNEKPVKDSPFKAAIAPSKRVDVSDVKVTGPGVQPSGVFLGSTAEFSVDAKSVTSTGEGKVKAFVTAPSGIRTEALCNNNNDGTYKCMYTPQEQGPHSVDVSYEGLKVPKSPFKVSVTPGCDPSRVKAYGPGLTAGNTNQPQTFTIETRGAGQGGLGLAIEGPSEAKMSCKDNRDGSCTVEYLPTRPGDYDITIKFADQNIPGSPFCAKIADEVNPQKVRCYGPGIDPKGVRKGQPAHFNVDVAEAGQAPLEVAVTDKNGNKRPAQIQAIAKDVYDVVYFPDLEGDCKVEVKYAQQNVPNSPFQTRILPPFDPKKVKVAGEGIQPTGLLASIPTNFTVDVRDAGTADLDISIQGPDGRYLRPTIKDNGDGTATVTYTPTEVGRHTVNVKYGGQDVPGAPFVVKTAATGDASKVKIPSGILTAVPVGEECVIMVDATEAGKGNVTCRIQPNTGDDVDIDIVPNPDGTHSLVYTPRTPGVYQINIKFGGLPVPDGDVAQEVGDLEAKIAPQLLARMESIPDLYRPVDFSLPVGPIFQAVSAVVTTPRGRRETPRIEDNKNGTVTVHYQPSERGLHSMDVTYNEVPVQGSPFKFYVDAQTTGRVTAYGPGLSHGTVGQPADFTIVTKDAGPGGLALAVEGPSKAEIQCVDNKDGTCSVSYLPTAPGTYNVTVKFAEKHIAGSPFTAKITGTAGLDKVKASLSVGTSSEVSLKVSETDLSNLTATIRSPSGAEEPCLLKRLANGNLGISFTPHEVGEHLVNVYRHGQHIPNSPFKIIVGESEIGNASKVKAYGPGLEQGMANEYNDFIVDTKDAGYGGLSLAVEGPSKADIDCHDNEDGTCRVTYKPTEPGNYIVNVKFADEHIPGSPFLVKVGGESSRVTEKILRQREAVDVSSVGSQCELSLKIPGTNLVDMEAAVTSPSGKTERCEITKLDEGVYSIKFVPKELGVHTVHVKHKGLHIPGSPFQFTVGPITDGGAHKVRAIGPGLERGEVNKPCHFNIYTREAGAGGLSIAVEGPSKAEIDFQDRKDGSCGVAYTCTEPGEYQVSVKFNDQHIPDSPFRVFVSPTTGEARKLTVDSLQGQDLQVNVPAALMVDFHGAQGKLAASVVAPSGTEDQAVIQQVDADHYAVRFIPKESGLHLVHVKLNGNPIPGSPFRALVGQLDADAGFVRAYGDGLSKGRTGEPCKFIVDTTEAGSGALSVTVDGPSKVQLNCLEVANGYEFSYIPSSPGDYLVTIKYAGNIHVPGSPFKARIEGPNLQDAPWGDQGHVVVETVAKSHAAPRHSTLPKDASKVVVQGMGTEQAALNRETQFNVDASNAGVNILLIGMLGPSAPCDELHVKHLGKQKFNVTYAARERGDYVLVVKWGEDHVPGSPFHISVK